MLESPAQPRAEDGQGIVKRVQSGTTEAGLQVQGAFVVLSDLEACPRPEEEEKQLQFPAEKLPRLGKPLFDHGKALRESAINEKALREVHEGPQHAGRIVGFVAEPLRKRKVLHGFAQPTLGEHGRAQPEVAGPFPPLRGNFRALAPGFLVQQEGFLQLIESRGGVADGEEVLCPLDQHFTAERGPEIGPGQLFRFLLCRLGSLLVALQEGGAEPSQRGHRRELLRLLGCGRKGELEGPWIAERGRACRVALVELAPDDLGQDPQGEIGRPAAGEKAEEENGMPVSP